ncbi:S9 family peptidase [Sphingomonas sp. LB-2]|uniref:alpha/beta hydrolase family protein n=1 Tax=Sphingomonas caeni TaxID=2984949 RepID=UPI00222E0B0B|nr:S9 family peptidase [Sphingomonas caeni]MCW3847282.1 S9 family peptidase [Sphingomonas caeni]
MLRQIAALAAAAALALAAGGTAWAQSDLAKRFGEREGVEQISLSPDGNRVIFLAPGPGPSTVAYVATVGDEGAVPKEVISSDGKPERLTWCRWSALQRAVCQVYIINASPELSSITRLISIGTDGTGIKMLSAPESSRALGFAYGGGNIIDWLPESDGDILMSRWFIPERTIGSHTADERQGYGVDRVDTRTLRRSTVEQPVLEAGYYLTDGHGTIRVMASMRERNYYLTGETRYFYRTPDSREWKLLSIVNEKTNTGFTPLAVDRDLNVAYGLEKAEGRYALFKIALDGSGTKALVYRHDRVDVDGLVRVGRHRRVVGVSFATDRRQSVIFDPAFKAIATSLSKALPGLPLVQVIDASADENRLLLWAGSDVDPGRYYVFDRKARKLMEIMLSRPSLEGMTLAEVKPVTYKAADGAEVPAYLTLPPGSTGKKLPTIVMPHGGPGARDEWGFDWLAQFFAARGYAVLQPNFRGSTGYGDSWFVENGFKSWRLAIGDVNDGGRWLIEQGIADPNRIAIVGWSYGGYAALQSAVLDPTLFKAVVAIAPVTDLGLLKSDASDYADAGIVRDFIGSGPHVQEGSPAQNAKRITAPVLMFQGDLDLNVNINQPRAMERELRAAGKRVELRIFPGLDHQLVDGNVRAQMLDQSDVFLRSALHM